MMKKTNPLFFIILLILTGLNQNDAMAQASCGNCVDADFTAGCGNGITTCATGDINCTFLGTGVLATPQDFPDIFGPGVFDTPEYCTDFTTPMDLNGNSEFSLGAFAILNTFTIGIGTCVVPLATFTLYDTNCNMIPAAGGIDAIDAWETWGDEQICCNTTYTVCVQYLGVECPSTTTSANFILPELYYITGDDAQPEFALDATEYCDGDPVTWSAGVCSELSDNGPNDNDVIELYKWSGPCAITDPSFPMFCGVDDITQLDQGNNLTRIGGNFTCSNLPTDPAVSWDGLCNDPCAPKTVTYFMFVRNLDSDCDGDGNFDYRAENNFLRYEVTVYPPQPITEVADVISPVCPEATNVITVEIGYDMDASGTLDGNEICDTKTADAPTNNTCAVTNPLVEVTWTATEIAALTGAPVALNCYTDETVGENVMVFPDVTTWVVTETPGDCGVAASVSIDAGTDNCFSETGNIPEAGVCPNTDGTAPLTYTFNPMFPADCNMIFTNTIDAICAPVDCCPEIAPAITTQVLCTGEEPDFTIIETEVNATGANIGEFSYFMDAAFSIAYAASEIINLTCDPIDFTIHGRLQCADVGTAGTPSEFDDFTFVITVFPNANNFDIAETVGECNVPASVSITAENGDECFAGNGNTPIDPGCDNSDDVQDYTYSFDSAFPVANCNVTFGNTIPASCMTISFSGAPSFECPPATIDYCDGGLLNLLQVDLNKVAGALGSFSGTALPYIIGSQDPEMNATIDVSTLPIGIPLTLEYTINVAGCVGNATNSGCTFIVFLGCDADGGRF